MMRAVYIHFLLFSCMVTSRCSALSDEQLFRNGNEQYAQGDYAVALTAYEAMQKKGPAAWYNMGNAAYRCGQYAHACLYWLRAEKGALPAQQILINHNMMVLRKKLDERQTYTYRDRFKSVCDCAVRVIPLLALQVLFLSVWWLLCIIAQMRRRRGVLIIMIMMLLINGLVGGMIIMKYFQLTCRRGIVMQSAATLFAGPQNHYHSIGQALQASECIILESRVSWHKVCNDRHIGWVSADDIMVV